jgi:hypothetical protein
VAPDPNNANRMYASIIHYAAGAGQGGIWMTNDLNNLAASIWTKLANPPRTEGHPASIVVLNDGKMLCTYSGRRNAAGTFTASSGVFLYDPVANTWSDVSHADMQYWTKDIVIDPSDATQNTWYVAVFSGWGGAPNGKGGLFKTTNRGSSWTKLTGTQFDRVTSITFNPLQLTQAYLTTEVQGLWMSNNMNAAIPTWAQVSAYPFRQPERVFFNPFNANEIWVSSFGNGLKMGLQSGPVPVQLLSFDGNRNLNFTNLQWRIAQPGTGVKFGIERSVNGLQFTAIGTVHSSTTLQYNYKDTIASRTVFYRIKMMESSGEITYSETISFRRNSALLNDVVIVKNPILSNEIQLQIIAGTAGKLQFLFTDLNRKRIIQRQLIVSAGTTLTGIQLPANLASGMYLLRVQGTGWEKTIKIVK